MMIVLHTVMRHEDSFRQSDETYMMMVFFLFFFSFTPQPEWLHISEDSFPFFIFFCIISISL